MKKTYIAIIHNLDTNQKEEIKIETSSSPWPVVWKYMEKGNYSEAKVYQEIPKSH